MALMKVNPTRMELKRLKLRLQTATRGHKLLKDKSDEMIRQFMLYARENKALREELEKELETALKEFMLARAVNDDALIEEAVAMSGSSYTLKTSVKSIMSVNVPVIETETNEEGERFPYSFATISSDLDRSVSTLSVLLEKLVRLAAVEKTCSMLADEIEKNRRRVNALEFVMIPECLETIKYISMKLDESERGNIVRLMKVKAMIEERNRK